MMKIMLCLLPVFIILSIFGIFPVLKIYALNTTEIFGPEDKPYGLSYEEHAENFWKWLVSNPVEENPELDLTGEKCTRGQQNSTSPIFYLSGSGVEDADVTERTCEVPSGKGILIPLMVVEYSDKEIPNATIEDLSRIAKNDQDGVTSMYLRLDDKEYQMEELSKYRIHTNAFELNFPKNAMYNVTEGPSIAVADGHYMISKPLSK